MILTSNRTRDLHDALKRRCLYHWIDYPPLAQAIAIVRAPRARGERRSSRPQVAGAVQRLRSLDVQKPPGVAEAIDWVHAAQLLGLEQPRRGRRRAHARLGAQVPRGPRRRPRGDPALDRRPGARARRRPSTTCAPPPRAERDRCRAASADLAAVIAAFGHLLHQAGVPVTPERSARFARAVLLADPTTARELAALGRTTLLSARTTRSRSSTASSRQVFRGRRRLRRVPRRLRRTAAAGLVAARRRRRARRRPTARARASRARRGPSGMPGEGERAARTTRRRCSRP